MKKILQSNLVLAFVLAFATSYGQMTYVAANATNTAGTYIDLGTNGTVITTANFDDANSAPQPIGFTFTFGCRTFTEFVLNTNGFIKLGNTNPSTAALFYPGNGDLSAGGIFNSTNLADRYIISAFNHDLTAGTGTPEYRTFTIGTPGSQVTTIQFKNLRDKTTTPVVQYGNIEFQIRLYEGTNKIELVYGTWTASAGTSTFKSAAVGLKTSVPTVLVTKTSTGPWATSTFINGNYTGNTHNHRNSVLPDAGRTYSFSPSAYTPLADVAATHVYTYGKIPLVNGGPHTITTRLINNNTCDSMNVTATLNITGANTYTDAKTLWIQPAQTVIQSFAAFSHTNLGTDTVVASVPADVNNTNNITPKFYQKVTPNVYNWSDTTKATNSVGINVAPGGGGYVVSRFFANGIATIASVNVYIAGGTNLGKTVYAVVMDPATGLETAQSANLVISAADTGKYVSFAMTIPPTITNGFFYAGLAQPTQTGNFFPVGTQTVSPAKEFVFLASTMPSSASTFFYYTTLGRFMIEAVTTTGVGIVEASDGAFAVYPNPANDQLNFIFTDNTVESLDLKLISLNGQVVYNENIGQFSGQYLKTLDISGYAKGVYFLQVTTNKEVTTKKVVID
ncbi:MAG: T9SS type A sorting domain-containing protein [Bacteroidota bacterium]